MDKRADVLIAGGGVPGFSTAIGLKAELGMSFEVMLVDPAIGGKPREDGRASAIAAGARRFLQRIGVWDALVADAQPILDMEITDSHLDDPMRPRFLGFEGELEPGEPFAHMVDNLALLAALEARARDVGVEIVGGVGTSSFETAGDAISVMLSNGDVVGARLLVAADGARSRLREAAGIAMPGWTYDQVGIVTTVAHERDHEGRAEEHFLPGGPFATLPLTGNRSSIVWTERKAEADRIMALDDAAFHAELEKRFGLKLGEIKIVAPRAAFPLSLRVAGSFVAERLALVGDSAHVIHPIAGQGLNLGFRDAAALCECVIDVAELGLDIGAPDVLERYQRWRRFDTVAMAVATDGLNRLFSNDSHVLRFVRDFGLGLVERFPAAKRMFIREAAGVVGAVPRLMQ